MWDWSELQITHFINKEKGLYIYLYSQILKNIRFESYNYLSHERNCLYQKKKGK